ncbi:phytanoyl-CoA dioxygenase family protein [Nitzschia inconspicua]|uniref:Phytanoyl-CoA dioxygenase family protein n=1 Tax=Nitzschia inconspicua TaxID=303405 RepID=A0A9K3KWQ2_9STRA|nr:phytanoyl-CoA dioxygenase family protein [Nitzschia inconspicua]
MPSYSCSCLPVTFGLVAVTVAILIGYVIQLSAIPSDIHIQIDTSGTASKSTLLLGKTIATLTPEQIRDYHRDGVVFVPNLLSEEEAAQLKDAANYASSRLFDVFGLFGRSLYKTVMFDLWRTSSEIASLSLQALPQVAAQLMTSSGPDLDLDNNNNNDDDDDDGDDEKKTATTTATRQRPNTASIRLLRDAFFAYQPPGEACGWHVDDAGFWPAVQDTSGPTFWIALDPLSVEEGGGLTVLNRTLFQQTEPFDVTEESCRQAIATNTCNMTEISPSCHAKMEAAKIQMDMRPGDAIIWDRFTFHRGVAGTDLLPNDVIKQRYSVRYIPKESRTFGLVHSSVEQLAPFDSPYYPQVWPKLLDSEMEALERGLDSDITLISAISFQSKRMMKTAMDTLFPRRATKEDSVTPQ